MASNRITVSADRMEMATSSPSGQRATLRSARPEGFTPGDIDNAAGNHFRTSPQQRNRTW